MTRTKIIWITITSVLVILIGALFISYFWITRIYLPEQYDAHDNSRLLMQWEQEDTFVIPADGKISEQQLLLFLKINEQLFVEIEKLRQKFEEKSWTIAFEVIKMQPEWAAKKYIALKKFHLSPKEYDWIGDSVIHFWIYKWKKETVENLRDYGWELETAQEESIKPVNYNLFVAHEHDLNRIFDILWPEKLLHSDSSETTEQTLP